MEKRLGRIGLTLIAILSGCVSTGSYDDSLFNDAEISAMAAVGRLDEALAGPLYEGDGGRDIRLAVLAPELRGAGAGDEWLPVYVQGLLHSNFRKYSAMTLVDRQNLDQIIAEQDLAAGGRFSDKDFIRIGNLINVRYFLTGTVQKLPNGEFALSLSVTEASTGASRASFMKNGGAAAVQDGILLNDAAESLLAQMGVTLTETGRRTLRTGRYMAARAEAGYARGVTAEAGGAAVEALLNYSQAVAFDPSRLEALSRLGSVSSEISGGSVSAHILGDLQARRAWLEAFKEAAAFFNSHPPFEIAYDPNLLQVGVTDYVKERADLAMRVSLIPSEAGFGALNALLEGLEKTGRRELWGFGGWPLLDITPKTPEALLFPGIRAFNFTVEAGLVNERGKVIARGRTTLKSGALGFKAGDAVVQPPEGVFGLIGFPKINVADLTPTLTVVIAGVNKLGAREISETGYMRIAPGDVAAQEAEIYKTRGDAWYYKEDYDRAIADYNEAIRLNPQYVDAYYNRGDAYQYGKEDYDRAIADYSEVIRLAPQDATAYYNRGRSYHVGKEDYNQAIADYSEAIRLNPQYTYPYNNRGNVYRDGKEDYDRAIEDYNEAIRLNPQYALAWRNRGYAYRYGKKDYSRAREDYETALQLDPNVYGARQDLEALQKEAESYKTQGDAYSEKKDYDRAIADYSEAIRRSPQYAAAYFSRGYAYHVGKGDYDRAIADYSEVIRLDPQYAYTYNNRGNIYYDKKDYDRAIADYSEAIRLNPQYAYPYNNRGLAYHYGKKDYRRARADYEKALQLDPNYTSARSSLEELRKAGY